MFDLVNTQPHAVASSVGVYTMQFRQETQTVREIVEYILDTKKNDWGYIVVGLDEETGENTDELFKHLTHDIDPRCLYKGGEIVEEYIPEDLMGLHVVMGRARGGSNRMDYILVIGEVNSGDN